MTQLRPVVVGMLRKSVITLWNPFSEPIQKRVPPGPHYLKLILAILHSSSETFLKSTGISGRVTNGMH